MKTKYEICIVEQYNFYIMKIKVLSLEVKDLDVAAALLLADLIDVAATLLFASLVAIALVTLTMIDVLSPHLVDRLTILFRR